MNDNDLITVQSNADDEFIHIGSIGSKRISCGGFILKAGGQHYETVARVDCPICRNWIHMSLRAEGNTRGRKMIQRTVTRIKQPSVLYVGLLLMAIAALCLWRAG